MFRIANIHLYLIRNQLFFKKNLPNHFCFLQNHLNIYLIP